MKASLTVKPWKHCRWGRDGKGDSGPIIFLESQVESSHKSFK